MWILLPISQFNFDQFLFRWLASHVCLLQNFFSATMNESSPRLPNSSNTSISPLSAVLIVSMGCTVLLAVFGNVLVLLAVPRTRSLGSTATVLVVNLAIVDLLITITVVPFVMTTAVTQEWILPQAVCNITAFINAFLTAGQIMALLLISVNRYIAVVYPHRYETRCNKRGTLTAVITGWLYSIIWTSVPFYGWGEMGFIKGTLFCNILWSVDMAYAITAQTFCYFIPSIVGAVLYLLVYRQVRLQGERMNSKSLSIQLRLKRSTEGRTASSYNGTQASPSPLSFDNLAASNEDIRERTRTERKNTAASASLRRDRRRSAVEARVTKTLLAVATAFVICWFPRGIANLWAIFASREDVPRALEYGSTVLVFFNAAVNPILYGALHQDFKRAFKSIICCECITEKDNQKRSVANGNERNGRDSNALTRTKRDRKPLDYDRGSDQQFSND